MKFTLAYRDGVWVYYDKKDNALELVGDVELAVDILSFGEPEVEIELWDSEPTIENYKTLELRQIGEEQAVYETTDERTEEIFPLEMIQKISDPIPKYLYCDWL